MSDLFAISGNSRRINGQVQARTDGQAMLTGHMARLGNELGATIGEPAVGRVLSEIDTARVNPRDGVAEAAVVDTTLQRPSRNYAAMKPNELNS